MDMVANKFSTVEEELSCKIRSRSRSRELSDDYYVMSIKNAEALQLIFFDHDGRIYMLSLSGRVTRAFHTRTLNRSTKWPRARTPIPPVTRRTT